MNNKNIAVVLAALTLLAPAIGGVAIASETVAFGGGTASTADQVSTTQIQVGSSLNNTTVQMTEDQSVSADGSVFYETSVKPESAGLASTSGSGSLDTTIVDDGVYVNETGGSSSATLESLNLTFDISDNVTGEVPDAINVSEGNAMESATQLVTDDDGSETHDYRVYGADNGDVLDWEVSSDNGEFNETTGEYVPNETGETEFTISVTRNNTTYEDMALEDHIVHVSFDQSGFDDIEEETNETAGVLVLTEDGIGDFVDDGDEDKGYKFRMVEQNNTTRTYTLAFNATVENADENKSLIVESVHDPKGGAQASAGAAFGLHNLGDTSNFLNVPVDLPMDPLTLGLGATAIILVVGGIAYASDMNSGFRGYGAFGPGGMGTVLNVLWLGGIVAGLSMIVGPFTPFWEGILIDGLGLPDWGPMVTGFVVSVGSGALAVRKHLTE